jgi:tight adherence protein B
MGTLIGFAVMTVVVWAVALTCWTVLSKRVRSSDIDKMKGRILGGQKKAEKSDEKKAALFQPEDHVKGKIVRSVLTKYNLTKKLQDLMEQAGVKWDAARFVHACMGFFIAGYVLFWLFAPAEFRSVALLAAIAAGLLPFVHVWRLKKKRLHSFEEIFPDALEFVSRSMRAGHAFSVSLEMIHREFQEPLAGEFKRTFEEHNLGLSLDNALQGLVRRVPLLDVHFFVSAVMLQKRTGGNLAEILDKLAYIIRERFKLRGRIRAVSAHGKMTAIALSCIPIAVAILMFFTNPDYVKFFFTDDIGQIMFGVAVTLQIIGYLIMKKIVSIEV